MNKKDRNAILLYGYTFSQPSFENLSEYVIPPYQFIFSLKNLTERFPSYKYDIIVHCWKNDPLINDYIVSLKPKFLMISPQDEVPRIEDVLDNISSRVFVFNKFRELLLTEQYDMVMLRRFDLIFKKDVDFNALDRSKIHLIYDYKPDGRPITQLDEDGYFVERLNDYQLTCSYENMLKFLDFNIQDIPRYLTEAKTHRKDMHTIIAQRLRHVDLYDKINYFIENPYDVVITKWYNYSKDLKRKAECVS